MTAELQYRQDEFLDDVLRGLSQKQKTLPCRWFYDERGSQLFEEITMLPEYYLTRVETCILQDNTKEIAAFADLATVLVEYGAGASVKTRILLDSLTMLDGYIPIDVSADFLLQSASELRCEYPQLRIAPLIADFNSSFKLPASLSEGGPVGFFPGSTIGNLDNSELSNFLELARRNLGDEAKFILGADLIKPENILLSAYNDAQGITAEFNKNLLLRINNELDADFKPHCFAHEARWNLQAQQIEMHLISCRPQTVGIADKAFQFEQGESIFTERSRKFDLDNLSTLCQTAGWSVERRLSDADNLFAVMLMQAVVPD